MTLTWSSPTRVVFGEGVLARLPALVEEVAGADAPVFLVTGRRSLKASGVHDRILESLGPARVTVFDDVPAFPAPDVPDRALSNFALNELTPEERKELKLSLDDESSRERLVEQYWARHPAELARQLKPHKSKRP